MAAIQTTIELEERVTENLFHMIDSATMGTEAVGNLYQMINSSVNVASMEMARESCLRIQQTIEETGEQQRKVNDEIDEGADRSEKLKKAVEKVNQAFDKMKEWIQDCTSAYDTQLGVRLQLGTAMANRSDTLQFSMEADTSAVASAYNQIIAKAGEIQGKGIYSNEVMIGAATELTTYFTDTNAIGVMMDTLADYAMGMTGGGEIDAAGMAAFAADLGKTTSGDYDAMSDRGFEFSEAQKAIIQGEATREQIVSALGDEYLDMSSDMQAAAAIAQVVGEAWSGIYESMSNTPEGRIIQLANAWNGIKESVGGQLYPYLLLFVGAITENWGTIQAVIGGITTGFGFMLGLLSWLAEGALYFAQMIVDNWSWISPILYGIIAALAVYSTTMILAWLSTLKSAAATAWKTVCDWAETAAIIALIVAQDGLNAAFSACPITWLIILVIALIAAFYAVIAAINKLTGSSVSATGVICGIFGGAAAFIWNLVASLLNFVLNMFAILWNFIAAFANFFANVFNDPVGTIVRLFFDLADTVLGILEALASAVDTIFGSGLSEAVGGWRDSLGSWVDERFGQGEEVMKKIDNAGLYLDRIDYKKAIDVSYSFGQGIDERISDFDPVSLFGGGLPEIDEYLNFGQGKNVFGGK